jgi:hypothetical protein
MKDMAARLGGNWLPPLVAAVKVGREPEPNYPCDLCDGDLDDVDCAVWWDSTNGRALYLHPDCALDLARRLAKSAVKAWRGEDVLELEPLGFLDFLNVSLGREGEAP